MNNLTNTSKFSMLSDNALFCLFDNIFYKTKINETEDIEKSTQKLNELYLEIKKRYFKNYNFNIYKKLFKNSSLYRNQKEIAFKICYDLIIEEFSVSEEKINEEYLTDCLEMMFFVFDTINKSDIEWDFTLVPKLIKTLNSLQSKHINNPLIIPSINNLITLIEKVQSESKKKKAIIPIKQEIKIENKTIKIQKSKLLKNDMMLILKNLHDYPEDVQEDMIAFALKKWSDMTYCIPADISFKYFCCHTQQNTKEISKVKPPHLLLNTLSENINGYMNVFSVKSINELVVAIKEWYSSLEGATEFGTKIFMYQIYNNLINCFNSKTMNWCDNDNLKDYYDFLYNEVLCYTLDILKPLKNCSFETLMQKINIPKYYNYISNSREYKIGYFVDECGIQHIIESTNNKFFESTCLDLIFKTIDLLSFNNILFSYCGTYINDALPCFKNEELETIYGDKVKEFFTIIQSFTIIDSDFEYLLSKSIDMDFSRKISFQKFIQFYLCMHKDIDKNILKLFISNEDRIKLFNDIFGSYSRSSGSYHDVADILNVILEKCADCFNFANYEDTKKFFMLRYPEFSYDKQWDFHNRKKLDYCMQDLILNKLQKENKPIYDIVVRYCNNNKSFLYSFFNAQYLN